MAFPFSERQIEEYHRDGYTVFRGILPPALIAELRRVTDKGRELARARHGPQAQRLQPVFSFDLDLQPFRDYLELPALVDSVQRVLTPRYWPGNPRVLGVLLEPADEPWCTNWHRDLRDFTTDPRQLASFAEHFSDINFFNQVNCALYEDDSTWIVPGSHLRAEDSAAERERFPTTPAPGPKLDGLSAAERERVCLEYCQSMPGAVRLHLDAGDYCLYRNTTWHIGSYVPYRKRATLHDTPSPRDSAERHK
ncbi:MAG TPA: phytanoyl-CoA dioxygenase family protein [Tepidisphaeraceae bacterium]|jgi:ectoine hydroxylase-related dioxygenase (phytanoyl-CoA dioxygenase family)|nr:phytanoyl-CoA dioxygenase family protein [Tepidisphaeraceae bacterium]